MPKFSYQEITRQSSLLKSKEYKILLFKFDQSQLPNEDHFLKDVQILINSVSYVLHALSHIVILFLQNTYPHLVQKSHFSLIIF